MVCKKCGAQLETGAKFCGECGTNVDVFPDMNNGSLSNGITAGIDEKIVKKYTIGRYTNRDGEINVIITNKRVIRIEDSKWMGMQNCQIDEINIDAVHGTSTHILRSASIIGIVIAAVLALWSLSSFSNSYGFLGLSGVPLGIILAVAAFIILTKSFKPTLVFCLHGAIGGPALLTEVNQRGKIFGRNDISAFFQFQPTDETFVMLKEIGACIYDLKTMGDAAISKWSDKTE